VETDELAETPEHGLRRPRRWGRPAAIALVALLVVGGGALHVVPVATAPYEKAATEAFGVPVRIGGAHFSLVTGPQIKFERVSVGEGMQIALVRAHTGIGGLLSGGKAFARVELEGLTLAQENLGGLLFGALKGDELKIARISATQAKLAGSLPMPALDIDAVIGGNGALQSVALRGPDQLRIRMVPSGSALNIEGGADSFAVPFVPGLALSEFGVKGSATRDGLNISEFDGRLYEGVMQGSARLRWGATWSVEGELRVRNMNAAVFAPALVSEGRVEGRGLYSMSSATPARLGESVRLDGTFKIDKGVLGSFDLGRAIQTGGAQSAGRTLFSELNAQGQFQGGSAQFRNVTIAAGAMNAGASLDIVGGALSGRIIADLKTPSQTLRATLAIGGRLQDPILRK
jgi:hypothetical protein